LNLARQSHKRRAPRPSLANSGGGEHVAKRIRPSRLAQAEGREPLDFSDENSDSDWYEAEKIVDSRTVGRGRGQNRRTVLQYRIRYVGYGPDGDTWEDAANRVGKPLIREWKQLWGLPITDDDWAKGEDKKR
jgi:hypothetical protein